MHAKNQPLCGKKHVFFSLYNPLKLVGTHWRGLKILSFAFKQYISILQ